MSARIAEAIGAICIVAAPGLGGAQAVSRFDGVYDLRSTSLVPGSAVVYGNRPCSLDLNARPLHIESGHAAAIFRRNRDVAGDLSADGALTLMDSGAFLEFTGKIDDRGLLRGYLNTFDGCGYNLIWRRRPG